MTRYQRYDRSEKGRARRARYEGSTRGLKRRLADTHRKRLRSMNEPGTTRQV